MMKPMSKMMSDFVELNNGHKMPAVGLGTFQGNFGTKVDSAVVTSSVRSAIEIGYQLIDTAHQYEAEEGVGEAIRQKIEEGFITREDLFITTKLWCTFHRRDLVVPALKKSLSNLGLQYVDMFLIHWPMAFVPSDEWLPMNEQGELICEDDLTDITQTWQGMEECVKQGLTKYIGVSNFNINQLQRILSSCSIKPANNQIEVHPYYSNVELVNCCHEQGVTVVGYCPFAMPYRTWTKTEDPCVFTDPTFNFIGAKYKKTAAQVALRFQVQRGIIVIPKSNSPERQKENLDIFNFSLSSEEMEMVYKCNKDFHPCGPFLKSFEVSKECPLTDL